MRTRRVAALAGIAAAFTMLASGSQAAAVELVTIGPEKPLENRFGHILLRVINETGRDDAYDFGVGPFHRPLFILEAMLGRAMFGLRRTAAQVRFNMYWLQDRVVSTQRLALTEAQTRDLQQRLATNELPENRDYRYDHVIDNCSTRLRDLIDAVTDGSLRAAAETLEVSRTYRDDILVAGSGWLPSLIALDLVAGMHGEDPMGAWERAFLPDHLAALVRAAQNPALGASAPLVAFEQVLHAREAPSAVGGSVTEGRTVLVATGVVLCVLFSLAGIAARTERLGRPVGRVIGCVAVGVLFVFGSVGLVMLPMLVYSSGFIFSSNANALLVLPFDALLIPPALGWIRSGRPALGGFSRAYLNLRLVVVAGLAIVGAIAPIGLAAHDNGAFIVAAAGALIGLRCLPPSPAKQR